VSVELSPLPADPALATEGTETERLTVFVADDDATNRLIVTRMLQRCGHHAVAYSDGRQLLDALRAARCDVIIMDVEMPVLGGEAATREIRSNPAFAAICDIPIVALTALALEKDRQRIMESGMTAFLAKPTTLAALESVLHEFGARDGSH
jgi:two-component system CheB/CheR fusion protein